MGAVSTATPADGSGSLRRDVGHKLIGGVCAGLGRQLGVDPVVVRLAFILAAFAGGTGLLLYALAWAAIPADGTAPRRLGLGRGRAWQVALGIGCLALAGLLSLRELGVLVSDALVWPTALAAAGAALIWRQSLDEAAPAPAIATGERSPRAAGVRGRAALGAVLVLAAALAFLSGNDFLRPSGDALIAIAVVLLSLTLILAPWWLRLLRNLAAERSERVRSQERAELAAHLHDSVLQTLALVQKRADDPRAVATLARRQERELRAWLNGSRAARPGSFSAALEDAAAEVEDAHGVVVEVVTVGDRVLDERSAAVVAAAREALVNAAKFAPHAPVSLYAEVGEDRVEVFVRDRGPGFDPERLPADRRGVRESIVGRMSRHGGRVDIQSHPGGGTEVELVMEKLS